MITIKKLTKTYGKKQSVFTALDNVSFTVPDGQTVAIIGKSGSGKSTLMHIMSGLDHPTSGQVSIDGEVLAKMKAREVDQFRADKIGFIFQAFFIEANQSCYQNVMLPLEIAEVARGKRKQLVLDALAAVDLTDKAKVQAGKLSGGQKQRLAIARSIVNKPGIIFADEPTGNLDSSTGDKIIKLLFDLNKSLGSTLVIVTHDHELADKCQQQITLKDGKIVGIKGGTTGKKVK